MIRWWEWIILWVLAQLAVAGFVAVITLFGGWYREIGRR